MSENETAVDGAKQEGQEQPQANFALQRIYVKDISFESPNSPMVFQKQWKPEVKMDLNTKHAVLGENHYEVIVSVTLTVSTEGMTAYIVEVQQAGIFQVQGLEGIQLAQALNAFCPNLLFPYIRESIDTVVVKGSFPAMMMAPVNFDAIFAQTVKQKQKEAAEAAKADGSTEH
jgi:preprotein translocase subunit SecB